MKRLFHAPALLAALALARCATTQTPCPTPQPPMNDSHRHHGHHGSHGPQASHHAASGDHGHHGQGMQHGFSDPQRWTQIFDDPQREAWQRPDEIVRWLSLAPDARVADVGAGTGYFSVRLARVVTSGRVWAVDIEPNLVAFMQQRFAREAASNAFAVLSTERDALLPEPVDVVLVVDTYHHIGDRTAFFQRVRGRLRPNGRVVIVDFRPESTMGPPREMKLAPSVVAQEMTSAGFRAGPTLDTLPEQYVLTFVAP